MYYKHVKNNKFRTIDAIQKNSIKNNYERKDAV